MANSSALPRARPKTRRGSQRWPTVRRAKPEIVLSGSATAISEPIRITVGNQSGPSCGWHLAPQCRSPAGGIFAQDLSLDLKHQILAVFLFRADGRLERRKLLIMRRGSDIVHHVA